jgi:cyclic beta-1,2-glucan synthetase
MECDRVGIKGKGESVWLGWFLYTILKSFIHLCNFKDDTERAVRYERTAQNLLTSIEEYGWDGGWYRRAYFDDGTPLGSEANDECRIDSISQSWAVISGGGKKERVKAAMKAVHNHLVDKNAGLIKLLSPPFDSSSLDPGYIKGYVPGVRENGGQYTHAAVWTIMANALMGNGNQAWELYKMINPVNHTRSSVDTSIYKVEPYVMAADVYAISPHTGRGGWTWYTGSSGWMYRVGICEILGFNKHADKLIINPCIPEDWRGFTIYYRYGDTLYHIEVKNPDGVQKGISQLFLDEIKLHDDYIQLVDDGKEHRVLAIMGAGS